MNNQINIKIPSRKFSRFLRIKEILKKSSINPSRNFPVVKEFLWEFVAEMDFELRRAREKLEREQKERKERARLKIEREKKARQEALRQLEALEAAQRARRLDAAEAEAKVLQFFFSFSFYFRFYFLF